MNNFICTILLVLLANVTQAQLVDNKFDIHLGYSFGKFSGSETTNEDNYITPSLYANFNYLSGFSIKGLLNLRENWSVGLNYDYQFANNWESSEYSDFENAEIKLCIISPVVRMNKFYEKGLPNRLELFLEFGPNIGLLNLTLSNSLFEIKTINDVISIPETDNDSFMGIKGAVGIEYSVVQSLGFFLDYTYDINWVSSKLYDDKNFNRSQINVGLVIKFFKNKYYYY